MDIQGKTVLVLGGWGLVGSAISRRIAEQSPKQIIVTSLLESEAKEAVARLRKEFPKAGRKFIVPWWGNIFVRHSLKDKPRDEILSNPATRRMLIDDMADELTTSVLERSSIFQLFDNYRPEIVIDCINSATAIAYQDIFHSAREVRKAIRNSKSNNLHVLIEATERLLATQYTPQLIRHVQTFYLSMQRVKTKIYVKIGTSGTGGMGLNIPYTHSEERPSSVLLSKSAVAGAHTMLLFLMGRTPDAPITKEVKPTAAIAWKKIGYGEIKKRGKTIELVDCPPENGIRLKTSLKLREDKKVWRDLGQPLRSVFIDTGENGIFSRAEFEAIATPGQMQYVTPEEIAEHVIFEIKGGNTGHDVINALDNATMGPTYRAGYLFDSAMQQLRSLEQQHRTPSIAFEILGPPRLSKLLYEAHLLQLSFGTMKTVMRTPAKGLSRRLETEVRRNQQVRSQIVSIGIPILMPDGNTLLRGFDIKVPPYRGENELPIKSKSIDAWAHDGWVDLRQQNMERWKRRFETIMRVVNEIPANDTSSRHMRTKQFWNNFEEIEPGRLVGWIFSEEEHGKRMKL